MDSIISAISTREANKLAKEYNINTDVIRPKIWKYALNVELEHGHMLGDLTNLTNDDVHLTAKIVIAHLMEFPDYYKRLRSMEKKADKYWSQYKKPNIFN